SLKKLYRPMRCFINYDCSNSKLRDGDLRYLSQCTKLNLSSNLHSIPPNNFKYLTNLKYLKMVGININTRPPLNENLSLLLEYMASNNFKLHSLDISENRITERDCIALSKISCPVLKLNACKFD